MSLILSKPPGQKAGLTEQLYTIVRITPSMCLYFIEIIEHCQEEKTQKTVHSFHFCVNIHKIIIK